jgi:hypothetical protein
MIQKLLLITCTAMFSSLAFAGDPKYPVSAIPEALKNNVNAVIREDQMVFRILSKSKATLFIRQVVTILNDKGKDYATEFVGYDKLSKIRDLNGTVYDANGKQLKRLKNSDIYDQSAFDGFSLYSDARFKMIDLAQGAYPYTVEFEYELEFKYLFYIPRFVLGNKERVSVQHASCVLQFPEGLAPRYKTVNTDVKPKHERANGFESLTWSFENLTPIKFEPHSPSEKMVAAIIAAPSQFEYDSYSGTMGSWDEFGQWVISLNKGRNMLPEATKAKIRQLTEPLKTREQKVKAVYEYMQNKTRYVSIQLGIGGYQPFEASTVDETGYGDCKALSNYTVSLLESIGIKAHYVLIRAGEEPAEFFVDFPSSQFNHAIVAVPNGADTLWLECTSQTNPFGYQGSFTGDRKALLITDNGAKVVNTTHYTAEQNLKSRSADVHVALTGDARAIIKTVYAGLQYENGNLNAKLNNQYDEQKKWIEANTGIPSFDINSFSMANNKDKIPSAEVKLDLQLRRYATISGKRIFLTPNLMNRFSYIPDKVESRKTSVVRRTAYTDLDTIRYHLPEGVYPEFLPEPVKLKSTFGEYEATYKVDQGSLVYIRKLKMNKGEFPPESYQEMIDFFKGMNKADNTKLVFMSKT